MAFEDNNTNNVRTLNIKDSMILIFLGDVKGIQTRTIDSKWPGKFQGVIDFSYEVSNGFTPVPENARFVSFPNYCSTKLGKPENSEREIYEPGFYQDVVKRV